MAVGFPTKANWAAGDVLTASALDDLAGTVNLVSAPLYNAAGKNKIINGDFGVWQRGTSFTVAANTATYTADRFFVNRDGSGATVTASQQTFTPGTAPVQGYESAYFYRYNQSVAGSGASYGILASQRVEDVRTFANQSVTWSFWAKADTNRNITLEIYQNFGTGGSSSSANYVTSPTLAITSTWTRYSVQVTLNSLTGKTIGSNSFLSLSFLDASVNATKTVDTWGWQLEAGSYATGFQTATGNIQGELAACQRYYFRNSANASNSYSALATGVSLGSIYPSAYITPPVTMRVYPTSVDYATLRVNQAGGSAAALTSIGLDNGGTLQSILLIGTAASTIGSVGQSIQIQANNSTTAYIGLSAEL